MRPHILAAAVLAVGAAGVAMAQLPYVPDEWRYGRNQDNATLRYCIDPRDPDHPVAQEIARAMAAALLVQPVAYTVEDQSVTSDFDVLYRMLLEHCDVYLGFKLISEAYPDWLALSRPYYQAAYALVVADPGWQRLADVPLDRPIGATLGTTADIRLIEYLQALPAGQRWRRFPMSSDDAAIAALRDGTLAAALIWQPSLWARRQVDPALAGLRVIQSDPLPATVLGVGGALLSDQTFLRSSLDQAIAALIADGTLQAILDAQGFPALTGS